MELMLYEFELGYNPVEAIPKNYRVKSDGAVDHSTTTWWFEKFGSVVISQSQAGLKP